MRLCAISLLICALVAFASCAPWWSDYGQAEEEPHDHSHDEEEESREDAPLVTCGSVIKFRHLESGTRLHSHDVKYGGGSQQQSVTSTKDHDDPNSLWKLRGKHGTHCTQGTPISNGDTIRLQHWATGLNLHSHLHKSPLSKQQEVSCFASEGDTGDNWRVVLDQQDWRRGDTVRLVHVDTGLDLVSSSKITYGNPIPGQQEVACGRAGLARSKWATEEGIYFPPRDLVEGERNLFEY